MKAKELRIGNLFIDKYSKQIISVLELLRSGNIVFDFECYGMWEAEPIPLNKEWLLKFGFQFYIGWDEMEFWCLPKDKDNSDRFELYETLQGFEAPSGKIIKEVHTLQNCYFFHELSGEELIIK